MNYLIERGYKQIPDPYGNNRICFEVKLVDKTLLHMLYNDDKFQFIANDVVYFE